jgi:radical SAM protein with 4Fe4S-binding SPASM domain
MSDGSAISALDVIARLEAESGKPIAAMLELSDRCNEVCVHCYQVQGKKGELSTGEWRQILDQLAAEGVLMLTLSGGEVTLRKDFLELLAYARKKGFAVRLFTNGLTMTRELAEKIAEQHVVDVEISLYSTRADVHDFVTGVPGSFDKTVQGIRYLHELGVAVTIKAVMMNVNQAELPAYPAFAAELGVHFRIDSTGLVPREGYDRAPQALNPDRAHVEQLERQLRVQKKRDPAAQPTSGLRPASRKVCGAARTLHVEPNGEMRPCTLLEVDLGDVRSESPGAIFESERARGVRGLTWGDLHGCRVCELARRCSRCHAVALAETGDALGPHPSACAKTRAAAEAASGLNQDQDQQPVKFIGQGSRPTTLGPYRLVAQGVYEAFDEPKTLEDEALAQRLGWTRTSEGGKSAPDLAVRPGELIQIRRPGSKSSKLERAPGVGGHEHAAETRAKLSPAPALPALPARSAGHEWQLLHTDESRRVREG